MQKWARAIIRSRLNWFCRGLCSQKCLFILRPPPFFTETHIFAVRTETLTSLYTYQPPLNGLIQRALGQLVSLANVDFKKISRVHDLHSVRKIMPNNWDTNKNKIGVTWNRGKTKNTEHHPWMKSVNMKIEWRHEQRVLLLSDLKTTFSLFSVSFLCDSVDLRLTFFYQSKTCCFAVAKKKKKKKVMLRDHLTMTNVRSCCGHLMQIKWVDNICFIQILLTRAWGKGKMILCLSIRLHFVQKISAFIWYMIILGLP